MGLGAQYGTAVWNWVPSMAWPGRQDRLPSMALLDGTGCPVWHGLIGLGMDTQFGTVGQVITGSVTTRTEPRMLARHSQWSHDCVGTRVGVPRVSHPGTRMFSGVPGLGCPQGCSIPSRMRLSPRVSHLSTRVSSGMFHPWGVTSQDRVFPGMSHPILACHQERPAGTGLSGWGPWRW